MKLSDSHYEAKTHQIDFFVLETPITNQYYLSQFGQQVPFRQPQCSFQIQETSNKTWIHTIRPIFDN